MRDARSASRGAVDEKPRIVGPDRSGSDEYRVGAGSELVDAVEVLGVREQEPGSGRVVDASVEARGDIHQNVRFRHRASITWLLGSWAHVSEEPGGAISGSPVEAQTATPLGGSGNILRIADPATSSLFLHLAAKPTPWPIAEMISRRGAPPSSGRSIVEMCRRIQPVRAAGRLCLIPAI